MKKNTFFKLFIIIALGLFFRAWYLDKPEGLYFDEYFTWMIAKTDGLYSFFKMIMQNCHTPLYYFYLKFWMFIFPDTDISLRYSSVIPSIASIVAMYYLGKELKDEKCGMLTAFLTTISSFCIYFAQEVRPYTLIFLVSSLIFLFFIKSAKTPKTFNLFMFFTLNIILCTLHTLGIIFCIFINFFLFLYLYKNNSEYNKILDKLIVKIKYFMPFIIMLILLLPVLLNIALSKNLSQFWADFSIVKVICVFIDYFSPVQTNIVNTKSSFLSYIYSASSINFIFIIFALIPSIISLISIIKAVTAKNKIINYMLYACGFYFLSLIFFAFIGKMILITKYTTEIYPFLILAVVYGLLSFKKYIYRAILISILILLNIFYLYTSKDSVSKKSRPEGHRAAAELINKSPLKPGDFVILTYYGKDKFLRYLPENARYNFYSIDKYNFNNTIFNDDDYDKVIKEGKNLYKETFKTIPNPNIVKNINTNILSRIKKGNRVGILMLNNVSFLENDYIQSIINNKSEYEKIPFIFLVFSSLKINLLYIIKYDLKLETIMTSGDWTLYVYYKR